MTMNRGLTAADLADRIQRNENCTAARKAREHKVVPQFASQLDPVESGDDIAYCEASARVLAAAAAEVSTVLQAAQVESMLLRGFALQRWYPDRNRQFSDLDMGLRHLGDLSKALAALRTAGYRVTRPVIARRSSEGWWAAAALQKPTTELPHPIYLDITVPGPGITPFRHCRMLDDDWERKEWYSVNGAQVPVPSPTSLLSIFAVEMHERRTIIARDLLDLSHLLAAAPDVGAAARRLTGLPVRRGLTKLAEAVAASEEFGHVTPTIERLLAGMPLRTRAPRRAERAANRRLTLVEAVSRAEVRRALRHGAPVYGFPDPEERMPGVRGSALHRGLAGMAVRSKPMAEEHEVAYSIPSCP
ncbi:nucleotidyltransferase family protein [Streptomyces rubiginosohelvolus]|uniref:nucleotidyltransferase family protein n=1 Tax=Streptomyces rubiginosohelvolus TaxID=67362 RepID=UPI00368B0D4B